MNRFCRQRRIALAGAMLLAGGAVFGQERKPITVYGAFAAGYGTHVWARAETGILYQGTWSFGFTYAIARRYSLEEPPDYDLHSRKEVFSGG